MENSMNWDQYYLNICKTVGENSKCHSRQIGAILVKDKIVFLLDTMDQLVVFQNVLIDYMMI